MLEAGQRSGACQTCNATPVSNAPGCTTGAAGDTSWCLDLPPNPVAGISRLCRQVPIKQDYPTAHRMNRACARKLGCHVKSAVDGTSSTVSTDLMYWLQLEVAAD